MYPLHKHPKSKPYMTLVNIWKKFDYFLSIFARISMFKHFRDNWAYAEPIFFRGNWNFLMFSLVLLVGFLDGFSKSDYL